MASPRTLFDKIWDNHVIAPQGEGTYLIYIDLHLIHEVTTPQAFEGLKLAGRRVRRPDATMAVADHNVPTSDRSRGIDDPESKLQVDTLERNVKEFGIPYFPVDIFDNYQPVTTRYAINSVGKAKWNLGCAHALNTYPHVLSPRRCRWIRPVASRPVRARPRRRHYRHRAEAADLCLVMRPDVRLDKRTDSAIHAPPGHERRRIL